MDKGFGSLTKNYICNQLKASNICNINKNKLISLAMTLIFTAEPAIAKYTFNFPFSKTILQNPKDTSRKSTFKKGKVMDIGYDVIDTFYHNHTYFTEGLLFDNNGVLFESTGNFNHSKILKYNKLNHQYVVVDSNINDSNEFGEGIALYKNNLVQLLYQNNYIRIIDKNTLELKKTIPFKREGWGVCSKNKRLFASNGTGLIKKIKIKSNKVQLLKTIKLIDSSGITPYINELEFVNGYIFANIWQTFFIYIIDPKTGQLKGKIDLTALQEKEKKESADADILNGMAWNKKSNTLLVTGKYWKHFYEIQLKSW